MREVTARIFASYPADEQPTLLLEDYNPAAFGNMTIHYRFRDLFVEVDRDRYQLFARVGLRIGSWKNLEDLVAISTPAEPEEIGDVTLRNYERLMTSLRVA